MALGASLLIVVPAFLAWGRAAALIMGGGWDGESAREAHRSRHRSWPCGRRSRHLLARFAAEVPPGAI